MNDGLQKNALVLKIEYHREMAFALQEDSTSKSDFILTKKDHEKVQKMTGESELKEALRAAAREHRSKYEEYVKEFKRRFPEDDHDAIFDENINWMMDEIDSKKEPLEDPELVSKET